jgi:hypothetical protein
MRQAGKNGTGGGTGDNTAREHSGYADGKPSGAEPRPREKGDYEDPGKHLTGGNAGKGPWKEQGGAGHGEDYGARDAAPPADSAAGGKGKR